MGGLAREIARLGAGDPIELLDDGPWGARRPAGDPASALRLLALDAVLTDRLASADPGSLPIVSDSIRTRIISLKIPTSGADKS